MDDRGRRTKWKHRILSMANVRFTNTIHSYPARLLDSTAFGFAFCTTMTATTMAAATRMTCESELLTNQRADLPRQERRKRAI